MVYDGVAIIQTTKAPPYLIGKGRIVNGYEMGDQVKANHWKVKKL